MAIIKTVLGNIKGKVGNMILYEVQGQVRIRSTPLKVKDPKTPGQRAHRNRVRGVARLFRMLDLQLYADWQRAAEGMLASGYNLFVKRNLPYITAEGEVGQADAIGVSDGRLPLPEGLQAEAGEDGTVRITWERETRPCDWEVSRDLLQIVAYGAPKEGKAVKVRVVDPAAARRTDLHCEWQLPEGTPRPVRLYGYFRNALTSDATPSFYIGSYE